MEQNGIGRNMEISILDGRKWNWKEHGNVNIRISGMEMEGRWKSQKQIEGNGIVRSVEISKIDGRKWNWKEPGNTKLE